jgi:hypothetical protein
MFLRTVLSGSEATLLKPLRDFIADRKSLVRIYFESCPEHICVPFEGNAFVASTREESANVQIRKLRNPKLSILFNMHKFME